MLIYVQFCFSYSFVSFQSTPLAPGVFIKHFIFTKHSNLYISKNLLSFEKLTISLKRVISLYIHYYTLILIQFSFLENQKLFDNSLLRLVFFLKQSLFTCFYITNLIFLLTLILYQLPINQFFSFQNSFLILMAKLNLFLFRLIFQVNDRLGYPLLRIVLF